MNIGTFEIVDGLLVNYSRTLKDWFDIVLSSLLGLSACSIVVVGYIYTHFDHIIYWILTPFFICCIFEAGRCLR